MMQQLVNQFAACASGEICINSLPHTAADGSFIQTILRIVIAVVAALSLLFIVIGGFRYIVSQGDPGAITKAKSTIVYALIGLVVAILAQVIVVFVISGVTK